MARKSRRAKKARNSIRFARVPTGNETCGWCFMLSSRGFVYNSESSAMASSHKGCDCAIVPGVEHDTIDGYDPKGMAERWRDCVDTVNNSSLERRARAEWDAMSDAEKKRYHADISNETAAFIETLQQTEREKMERLGIGYEQLDRYGFVRFYQDRLRREACKDAERRDVSWLYSGKIPQVDYSLSPLESYGKLKKKSADFDPNDYDASNIDNRGNEWRDIFVHDVLSNSGFKVITRPTAKQGKDVDLFIGGMSDSSLWEVKSPERTSISAKRPLGFVEDNLRSASKQFHGRLSDDGTPIAYTGAVRVVFNGRYISTHADEEVIAEIMRQMDMHAIDEVLYVSKDGSLSRLIPKQEKRPSP